MPLTYAELQAVPEFMDKHHTIKLGLGRGFCVEFAPAAQNERGLFIKEESVSASNLHVCAYKYLIYSKRNYSQAQRIPEQ